MATTLTLCSVSEIDQSFEHVLSFKSKSSRLNYFINKQVLTVEVDFKGDAFRSEILIPSSLDDVVQADYLFFRGDDNQHYFYFIDSKSYYTEDTTHLTLTLDVFTTYQFDFSFMTSYVERCHVDRFTADGLPTYEVVDEGFNYSNYIQVEKTALCETQNSFIMSSSEPLGYITKNVGVGGAVSTNGLITKQGFRFIKGYEAFTPEGLYLNGEAFRTVGYGSTEKHNKAYYDLHKPFPVSEQRASELFAERIVNNFGNIIYAKLEEAGVEKRITQNMFDAMCSLAYNRGVNGFLTDTTSPFGLIKSDPYNFEHIRRVWEGYAVTSNGNILQGLVKRRKAEADIYCLKEYEMRSIGIYKNNGNDVGYLAGTVTDSNGNGFIPSNLPDLNDDTPYTTDEEGNTWLCPTTGEVTAGFPDYPDSFGGGYHGGIDFANSQGTPILASGSGTVAVVDHYQGNKDNQPYGNLVIINQKGNNTGNTYKVYYAHLHTVNVKDGDTIIRGQQIGTMGTTGNSTGNHLHYEIRKSPYSPQKTTAINPAVNLRVGSVIKGGA